MFIFYSPAYLYHLYHSGWSEVFNYKWKSEITILSTSGMAYDPCYSNLPVNTHFSRQFEWFYSMNLSQHLINKAILYCISSLYLIKNPIRDMSLNFRLETPWESVINGVITAWWQQFCWLNLGMLEWQLANLYKICTMLDYWYFRNGDNMHLTFSPSLSMNNTHLQRAGTMNFCLNAKLSDLYGYQTAHSGFINSILHSPKNTVVNRYKAMPVYSGLFYIFTDQLIFHT